MRRTLPLFLLMIITKVALPPVYAQKPPIVIQVRDALDAKDYAAAAKALAAERAASGITPAYIEAVSWMGRGYMAAKNYDRADHYAAETRKLVLDAVKRRKLDAEPSLPLALGASIEVQAQVLDARGQKAEAVSFLQQEVKTWHATSIRARVQKNLNLISLKGRPAPALDVHEYLGDKPPALATLKGRKVLLFFWAHWCADCKAMSGSVARLARENPHLVVIGPTQPYGYAAEGMEAPRAEEIKYIEQVRQRYYKTIPGLTVPVSEENFKLWGASTTPTVAVIDARGMVSLYHPGRMSYEELLPYVRD
ncbi:thioredoxin fold domain-containing protein [uncultured Paludibaculum sp.]|uniref:TlpA family protein disulfide reductase n=1 Tax=uncultured Paludibaculum sp. TaxID=1765020 RepID=UPI002AAAD146|nr:thioredoxin fold domain-containing protein [uncultured Paludibaculum sp.]